MYLIWRFKDVKRMQIAFQQSYTCIATLILYKLKKKSPMVIKQTHILYDQNLKYECIKNCMFTLAIKESYNVR